MLNKDVFYLTEWCNERCEGKTTFKSEDSDTVKGQAAKSWSSSDHLNQN